jgi:hypothetical protein
MSKDKYEQGVYIIPEVLEMEISPLAKILYGVLCGFKSFKKEGVWASRKFLANKILCSQIRISQLVKELKDADLVFFDGYKNLGNGNKIRLIKQAPLIINYNPPLKDIITPPYNKLEASNNNDSIYTIKSKNGFYGCSLRIKRNDKIRPSYYKFSHQIQEEQIQQHPSRYKQYSTKQLGSQIAKGAEVIDQLVRLDKWSFCDEIKPAIKWAVDDDFWTDQVLSLASLRNKSKNNGQTKFTNLFNSWESWKKVKDKKPKRRFEDERNPSRPTLERGADNKAHWVYDD